MFKFPKALCHVYLLICFAVFLDQDSGKGHTLMNWCLLSLLKSIVLHLPPFSLKFIYWKAFVFWNCSDWILLIPFCRYTLTYYSVFLLYFLWINTWMDMEFWLETQFWVFFFFGKNESVLFFHEIKSSCLFFFWDTRSCGCLTTRSTNSLGVTSDPFICRWALGMTPGFCYYKQCCYTYSLTVFWLITVTVIPP